MTTAYEKFLAEMEEEGDAVPLLLLLERLVQGISRWARETPLPQWLREDYELARRICHHAESGNGTGRQSQ